MRKDPHLLLASNGVADLRGKDGGILNLLSASEFSLNALFEFSTFLIWDMKVHGSFIVGVFYMIRCAATGTILKVEDTPNAPPALLHGLPGHGPPKRLSLGFKMAIEDVSVQCVKQETASAASSLHAAVTTRYRVAGVTARALHEPAHGSEPFP